MKNLIFALFLIFFSCSPRKSNQVKEVENNKKSTNGKNIVSYNNWSVLSGKLLNKKEVRLSDIYELSGAPKECFVNSDGQCVLIYTYYEDGVLSKKQECVVVLENAKVDKIGYSMQRDR